MNAITRAETFSFFPLPELRICILVVAIFATLLGIVYFKDFNRRLFINYQESQQLTSQLNTNYAKLLLEKSAWARQARVQMIAEQRLAMEIPSQAQVVMVKL
jgi:cell division protein FtsL